MAITRRQFVTTLTALAAAAGIGQTEISRLTEAFAHGGAWATGGWTNKPKVIWVNGAECTGDSTSLLGLFEDATGTAVEDTSITTLAALSLAVGGTGVGGDRVLDNTFDPTGHPWAHRTLEMTYGVTGTAPDMDANSAGTAGGAYAVDIADVVIDFIDLAYHETIMAMGGDLAYQTLLADLNDNTTPFVLVVEGAVQNPDNGGFWKKDTGPTPWCSIGKSDDGTGDHEFSNVVKTLAAKANCAQVVTIGQCATYGNYPAATGPGLHSMVGDYPDQEFDPFIGQTGAQGVYDFLNSVGQTAAAAKVINVPGCPVNPWWFILTVVAWLIEATALTTGSPAIGTNGPLGILKKTGAGALDWQINASAIDSLSSRRLNIVYGYPLHSGRCPRYGYYSKGLYATHPGDAGCLALIGCKGPSTKSLCSRHGWNNSQPHNSAANLPSQSKAALLDDTTIPGYKAGSHCITAGHPCMGCTQKGYPNAMSPFVVNR